MNELFNSLTPRDVAAILTYWGQDKMAAILQTTPSMHFLEWKCMNSINILTWCWSGDKSLSDQWCLVYWFIYSSLGLNEWRVGSPNTCYGRCSWTYLVKICTLVNDRQWQWPLMLSYRPPDWWTHGLLWWSGTAINTLRPRQDGRHFPDIFKRIFLNENIWIRIKISLKFVPKDPINSIPALVQIMAWRRPGDKPLSESMMVSLPTHLCVTQPQWVKMCSD